VNNAQKTAQRIKMMAKKKGITVKYILENCNYSKDTVSKMKSGSMPSANTVIGIAQYFNVTTDYLLGLSDSPLPVPDELNRQEHSLVDNFRLLNEERQEKAVDYLDDLVSSGKYIKNDTHGMAEKAKQA
jgi:transcriptional regulator with XRE-family HTH domain